MSTVTAQRPTNLKFIVTIAGGALVLGFLFLKGFLLPYQDNRKKQAAAEEDYDTARRDYLRFQKEKGRLERDRLLSMPRDVSQAGNDYVNYLQKLLEKCGFDKNPDVAAAGAVIGPSISNGKKAGHVPVAFIVRAQGTWPSVVKFLDQFQRTPFIHRLRNWSVDLPTGAKDKTKLVLNMAIETLVVNRNERRPENLWGVDVRLVAADAVLGLNRLPTGWATLLRAQGLLLPVVPKRNYGELVVVNPFVGGPIQNQVDPAALAKKKDEEKKKQEKEALAKAKLVFTDTDGQKAVLMSRTDSDKTLAINLTRKSTFGIWEGKKGKVLRVEQYDVYFEVESKIYGIHIGTTLEDAMKKPLSEFEWRRVNVLGTKGL